MAAGLSNVGRLRVWAARNTGQITFDHDPGSGWWLVVERSGQYSFSFQSAREQDINTAAGQIIDLLDAVGEVVPTET